MLARCDRMLGRLALAAGDTATAGEHLTAAATCLPRRRLPHRARRHPGRPGRLRPGPGRPGRRRAARGRGDHHRRPTRHGARPSAALAARARIRAAQATTAADPDPLAQGRDAADAALRLAVRHHLAWHELDALRAHAALDQAEHADHGWAAKADALHARLVPPGLDPDPLATVERLVAPEKANPAADSHEEEGEG